MERDGDVETDFNDCVLNGSCFDEEYKMCKDDVLIPFFYNASSFFRNDLVMDSQSISSKKFKSSADKIGLSFLNPVRNFVGNANCMPILDQTNKKLKSDCLSPLWDKPPQLQSFSSDSRKLVEKLYVQDSFLNGNKFHLAQNIKSSHDTNSISNITNCTKSNFNSDIDEKLLLDYEAETSSSSSFEDVYCSINKDSSFSSINVISNQSINSDTSNDSSTNTDQSINKCLLNSKSYRDTISPQNDRLMPDLLPTIISPNDNSIISDERQKCFEIIDIPDSPEMPTLIPFTSEVDEAIQIKTEVLSDDSQQQNTDSQGCTDSAENIQPKVMLTRINLKSNIFQNDKEKSTPQSSPVKFESEKKLFVGPEIEEIEGLRFFQFRSKHEMEDFNANLSIMVELDSDSLSEIIPTKTTDITQIKGWRTKSFAPESEFSPITDKSQNFDFTYSQLSCRSLNFNNLKTDDSNHKNKVSGDQNQEQNNNNSHQKGNSEKPNLESKDSSSPQKNNNPERHSNGDKDSNSDQSEEEFDIKKVKVEKREKILSPGCAFVSEELEKFLTHSSTLNVSFLQSVNPNIIPIPHDAPILSIGKLKKIDRPLKSNFIFKRKKEVVIEKLEIDTFDIDSSPNSPGSSSVLALDTSPESASSSSSIEDLPVTNIKQKRTILSKKKNLPNKRLKKKIVDKDLNLDSKRVVLRLRKDVDGVSKGYKVSNISCKNENLESSPSSIFSYEPIPMPEDGSLPVIKQTLFSRKK